MYQGPVVTLSSIVLLLPFPTLPAVYVRLWVWMHVMKTITTMAYEVGRLCLAQIQVCSGMDAVL